MIVAHAVHWLVALPAALVLAGLAIATFVEGRRSRRRGTAVLRDDEDARHGHSGWSAASSNAASTARILLTDSAYS